MDWFKGNFTEKPNIWWENLWFPVSMFPTNPIDWAIGSKCLALAPQKLLEELRRRPMTGILLGLSQCSWNCSEKMMLMSLAPLFHSSFRTQSFGRKLNFDMEITISLGFDMEMTEWLYHSFLFAEILQNPHGAPRTRTLLGALSPLSMWFTTTNAFWASLTLGAEGEGETLTKCHPGSDHDRCFPWFSMRKIIKIHLVSSMWIMIHIHFKMFEQCVSLQMFRI